MGWSFFAGGLKWVGHDGRGFAFDNEGPRHRVFLEEFQLGTRLVTSGEFLAFIEDNGYSRPEFWLSDGWNVVKAQQWEAPLYWERIEGDVVGDDPGWVPSLNRVGAGLSRQLLRG